MKNVSELKNIKKSLDSDTKKRLKKLEKYTCPHHESFVGGFAFGFLVVLTLIISINSKKTDLLLPVIPIAAISGFFFYSAIKETRRYRSILTERLTSDGVNTLLDDFEKGGKAFKESIILGQQNIYGKRSGEIIPYGSISRMYQYIEKDALFENDRKLCLELKNGKTVKIGMIPLKGRGNEELRQVFDYICFKNGDIKVGYTG